jgi:hypothetical protein
LGGLALANDQLNLRAVDSSTNRSGVTGTTRPGCHPTGPSAAPMSQGKVAVKGKHGLWVTSAERERNGPCPAYQHVHAPAGASYPSCGADLMAEQSRERLTSQGRRRRHPGPGCLAHSAGPWHGSNVMNPEGHASDPRHHPRCLPHRRQPSSTAGNLLYFTRMTLQPFRQTPTGFD